MASPGIFGVCVHVERAMLDLLANTETIAALTALTVLEIVLGIDNLIFVSILAGKLPAHQQATARVLGLSLAMGTRILLLLSLFWVAHLTRPLFHIASFPVTGRSIILLAGGIFLIIKSTHEIHERFEAHASRESPSAPSKAPSLVSTIVQIGLLDIVFSLDSVITAIGIVNEIWIMVTAIVIAVIVMMLFSARVSSFIDRNPTIKMLALSFLLLIGVLLIADGLGHHIPKEYVYFAMAFSAFVEFLNTKAGHRAPTSHDEHMIKRGKTAR